MNPVRSVRNRIEAHQRRRIVDQANVARDAGLWQDAAAAYREYLDLMPADPDIWVQLGHMRKEMGLFAEAEEAYRRALSLRPEFADTHLMLGHAFKLQDKLPLALDSYRRAMELDPEDKRPREEFARLSARLAQEHVPPPAVKEIEGSKRQLAASNENEIEPDALRLAGDRARDSRNWSDAAKAYRQYLEIRKTDGSIWVQYGHVLKAQGNLDLADAAYSTAEVINPDVADTFLNHGHLLKAMGRTEDAIRAFKRAVFLNPADTESAQEMDELMHRLQSPSASPPPCAKPTTDSEEAPRWRVEQVEADVQALREKLSRSEDQVRLMQGQSRAIRVLSSELMKLRQETRDLAPRIAALEAENKSLKASQDERLVALENELKRIRSTEPPHPSLLVEQYLARRKGT